MLTAENKTHAAAKFDEAALQTGGETAAALISLPEHIKSEAMEIRIRSGQPIIITTPDGPYIIDKQKLISRNQISEVFIKLCGNAIYSHQTEIASGCITIVGGHRVGICGRAIMKENRTSSIADVSSLCIRIAHEVKGCADMLAEIMKRCGGGMLIAGPPCSGKTTLLRDLALNVSSSKNTVIVDERNELAAVYRGTPQLETGCCCDVITGFSKAEGMIHAVKFLAPEIIVCDEIGTAAEAAAIKTAFNTGVTVAAAIHCGSSAELYRREPFNILRETGAFKILVLLSGKIPHQKIEIIDLELV